jgi:hypothetical protein
LRKILDEQPAIWKAVGNASALAERAWLELLADGNKLALECIPRHLRELKAELAGPRPSPLEKLLVDLVGVAWLAANYGEIAAASPAGGCQQAALRLRQAESGQKRLLGAVRTLALVRELLPQPGLPVAGEPAGVEAGGSSRQAGQGPASAVSAGAPAAASPTCTSSSSTRSCPEHRPAGA